MRRGYSARRLGVVDRPLLAKQVAIVRDAVARIRAMLPPSREAFEADRTAREVVVLNLFVAIQACLSRSFQGTLSFLERAMILSSMSVKFWTCLTLKPRNSR